jgi:preprotein translocase subunit YajC
MLQAEGGSSLGQFFPFIAIIIVFYFFMILPQSSLERVLKEDQK